MVPLPPPSGASLARPFHIGSSTQPATANPMVAASTPASSYMLGGYPVMLANAQANMPATLPITHNDSSGLPINIANNPRFTTMQGEHGLASSTNSCGQGDILESSNVNGQQPLSTNASYSNSIEMGQAPDGSFETAAPAPTQARTSRYWFPERRTIYYRSNDHQGGWAHIHSKKTIPQMLAKRLKKNVRAKVIADCKAQHFDECRRDIEALANKEFERMAKEHAAQLDSQRISAEKAIREARGERENLLKSISSLEHAKKAIESEAIVKDQQIRDLKADLQKYSVTAERALRKAQANSKYKSEVIMDLEAENASLKEQVDNVKGDLKASTVKVKDLEMALLKRPSRTEAKQQAQSILTLTDSVKYLKSIVAEQAQTLVACKSANKALVEEQIRQRSEKTVLKDKMARPLEKFYAKRQMKENLVKYMVKESAVDLEFTAAASAEIVPTAEEDEPTLSEQKTPVIPAVASAPTASSGGNILGNLILFAYCFLFGNIILFLDLASLLIFCGIKLFFCGPSNTSYTDLSAKEKTGPSAICTDTEERKLASMPSGKAWWEEH